MKVFTKRLSIKILSILLIGVLSLGGLFLHNGVKAVAAGTEEIATTDLLKTNANVTSNNGVLISSASQYEGEIKGVFTGDTTLKFNFPETYADTDGDGKPDAYYGAFTFRITDATDADNYFDVSYYVVNKTFCSTTPYVQYGEEVRMNNHNGSGWYNAKQNNKTTFRFAPSFLSYLAPTEKDGVVTEHDGNRVGILSLVWTEDKLAVQVNSAVDANEAKMVTIAEFDGTYDKNKENNGFKNSLTAEEKANGVEKSWGLPKLDLAGGYKISFSSNFTESGVEDHGSDVVVKEILTNGTNYDLTAATQTTPSFYTDYLEWQRNNPTDQIRVTDLLETTGTVTQDENGVRISSGEAYTGKFKGVFMGDTTLRFTFPETYTDAYYGEFTFRIADATDESNYFDIKYYVVNTTKHYTALYVQYQKEIRMSNHAGTAWVNTQQLNVQNYRIAPSFLSYCGENGEYDGDRMGILSLVWTDDVLAIQANRATEASATAMLTAAEFDGTYDPKKVDNGFVSSNNLEDTKFGLPKLNFENGYTISISSSFESEATTDKASDICFKEVAGVNFSEATVDGAYRSKVTFENAVVSNTNVYIPQNEEVGEIQLVYTHTYGLGGWQTREAVVVNQTIDTSTVGEKSFTITDDTWNDTALSQISKTYTVHVEKPYTLTFDVNGGEVIDKIVYSDHTTHRVTVSDAERWFWVFDGWYIDSEKWSGEIADLYGKDVTLTAHWLDMEAPTIWLNGVNDITYKKKGMMVTVGTADVVAGDAAQNESIVVTLALKKPNETEFSEITDGYALKLDTLGSYVIQYTVTDLAGYTATCERTIEAFERNAPTITVKDGYETLTYPGVNVEFAKATAKNADGQQIAVTVSVVKDGVLIENDGTSFVPTVMGEYTITFYAVDNAQYDNLSSMYSYIVVVTQDDVAPEIGSEFTDITVELNDEVTIPNVTASDNVTQNVTVEVSVYYGTQKINVSNNKFIADQEGTYRVVLTAEDEAGNKAEKVVYVTVTPAANNSGGNGGGNDDGNGVGGGGCSGCSGPSAGSGLGLPMGLLMMAGSFMFGKNVMMKKNKIKENI